jgi:hypothetical protein
VRRIRLVHWKASELEERAERLRRTGYDVEAGIPAGPAGIKQLVADPPAALVIDLSRMPSQGRDLGLLLRSRKATRHLPLVFVDGEPDKVERTRQHLPDAVYTGWSRIGSAVKRAIQRPPAAPVAARSVMQGYSGTPLPRKLGIKPGTVLALVGMPAGFEQTLGPLPEGVRLRKQARGPCQRIVWFVRARKELESRFQKVVAALAEGGGLWIAWPKQASGVATDLTQNHVRRFGLDSGLVDYKICAIDATWSGLLFTRRRPK